jgi:hypothetical protein
MRIDRGIKECTEPILRKGEQGGHNMKPHSTGPINMESQHATAFSVGHPRRKPRRWLAFRQLRLLEFCRVSCSPSTFLRALRSIPITGLLRYYGRSDSCPAGSSVAWRQHEHRLCPEQVSLLHAPELPIPPSPTTGQPLHIALARYPSARRVSRLLGSRFHHCSAGSPELVGRIEFVILRMNHSPPAALHPASRRRSCSRLQAGERLPGEDFHPSVQCCKCALAGARSAGVHAQCRIVFHCGSTAFAEDV